MTAHLIRFDNHRTNYHYRGLSFEFGGKCLTFDFRNFKTGRITGRDSVPPSQYNSDCKFTSSKESQ